MSKFDGHERALANQRLFDEKKGGYPFIANSDLGSPAKFQEYAPTIMFLRFPLLTHTVWAFSSRHDLDEYMDWCKDKPIILPKWRKG